MKAPVVKKTENSVLKQIADLGVKNPKKPTAEEIKMILDAYIQKKIIDVKSFEIYKDLLDSSLKTIFDGFVAFAKDETQITASTLSIIDKVIDVLRTELAKNLPKEERHEIRKQIFALVEQARGESKESRRYKQGNVRILVGLVTALFMVVAVGGGSYIYAKLNSNE
jgi:hypothetical protein